MLLKVGDEIREGDEFFGRTLKWEKQQYDFGTIRPIHVPIRRRVLKSELHIVESPNDKGTFTVRAKDGIDYSLMLKQLSDDKSELELKIGSLIHDKLEMKRIHEEQEKMWSATNNELQENYDRLKSYNIELQKKFEELDRIQSELASTALALKDEVDRRIKAEKEILYLKRSFVQDGSKPLEKCIEQAKQLQNLDSKIVKLKSQLETEEGHTERLHLENEELKAKNKQYSEWESRDCKLLADYRKQIEELKKQVPRWVERNHKGVYSVCPNVSTRMIEIEINGYYSEIPFPPQQPATDPAEEAWEKARMKLDHKDHLGFIVGYKKAMEIYG